MKHFTKDFAEFERLAYLNQSVKPSKRAEKKDEDFYFRMYQKQYGVFSNYERNADWYRDPVEDMRKINEYINEPNISEQEHQRRLEFKANYEYLHESQENKTVHKFDEELCKQKFAELQRAKIELCQKLPQEILNRIADIRVFALGYVSGEVKKLLRPYCSELRRTVRETKRSACAETSEAEKSLTEEVSVKDYEEFLIMGIEEQGGGVTIKGEHGCIIIKDGEIIEGKDHAIFPYDATKPNCPWSKVEYAELHKAGNKFELHFLVENSDGLDKEELWDLTLRGSDILDSAL